MCFLLCLIGIPISLYLVLPERVPVICVGSFMVQTGIVVGAKVPLLLIRVHTTYRYLNIDN